jgi:hypothetical protein
MPSPQPDLSDLPFPSSAPDDRRQAWVDFLRSTEARYAAHAAAEGQSVTPLEEAERAAVAQLAADLGLAPTTAFPALARATRRSA